MLIYKKIKEKRGSHLELIISFIIFIVFLVLVFVVVRPSRVPSEKIFLVKQLEEKIPLSLEENVTISSVINKTEVNGNCYSVKNIDGVDGLKVIAKDQGGNKIATLITSGRLNLNSKGGFFNIYYSQDLNEMNFPLPNGGCDSLAEGDYSLGVTKVVKYISKTEFNKLVGLMASPNNYEKVKKEYGVPSGTEFGFILKDSSQTQLISTINNEEKSLQAEVYSEEIPVSYIDEEGNINQGWLNIQAW